jgi:aspartyl-tRNA(Asn)/glutamyl-tRNA(Gln) amidotransferase subunit B
VELKNMNSFHNLEKALEAEIELQTLRLDAGEIIRRETKRWDVQKGVTVALRSKEDAQDYRYFPEPDLVRLSVTEADIEGLRKSLPELPEARRRRYVEVYAVPPYDADVLTREKAVSEFFESVCAVTSDKKAASNWVMGEVLRVLKEGNLAITDLKFTPKDLGDMINLIQSGAISGKIAKTVFEHMMAEGKSPEEIVREKSLSMISDSSAIEGFIRQVMEQDAAKVLDYRGGKVKLFGYFVGQVMKACQGKASPEQVNSLLQKMLAE